tara:strand:- start:935 stop:1378 length:444 start_codon:yes stop_codon:yes gene_type:complete
VYNKIDVTSPVRKFQNPIRNCFNSSASASAANAFSVWKRKKDVEILHALMRDAEENVFWIDDANDDDDVFVSALSISNPDLEETKRTPSFLRLSLELFEVLLVEEDAAILHKLEALFLHDDDKANMIENFAMFFCCFYAKKKISREI